VDLAPVLPVNQTRRAKWHFPDALYVIAHKALRGSSRGSNTDDPPRPCDLFWMI